MLSKALSKKAAKKVPVWNIRVLELMKLHPSLSTKEWCQQVGVLQTNLPGYKEGTRSFTIEQLVKVASMYNTTLDFLCGLTDHKAKPASKQTPLEMIEEAVRILKSKKA